jgi:sugar lactone lactonase YvrE
MIVGLDVAPDGSIYVVELLKRGFAQLEEGDFTGSLIRLAPNGSRQELAKGKIIAPGGVALGPEGEVYVTTNSVFPGQGQVLRIAG